MKLFAIAVAIVMLGGCNYMQAVRQANLIYSVAKQYDTSISNVSHGPEIFEIWEKGACPLNEIVSHFSVDDTMTVIIHQVDPRNIVNGKPIIETFAPDANIGEPEIAMTKDGFAKPSQRQYCEFMSKEWMDSALFLAGVTHISK